MVELTEPKVKPRPRELAMTNPVNSRRLRSELCDAMIIADENTYPLVSAVSPTSMGKNRSLGKSTGVLYRGTTLQNKISVGIKALEIVSTSNAFFLCAGKPRNDELSRPARSPRLKSKNVVTGTKKRPVKTDVFGY